LRESSHHNRQQANNYKEFLHGNSVIGSNNNVLGAKLVIIEKNAKNSWSFFDFTGSIIGNLCIFAHEKLVDGRNVVSMFAAKPADYRCNSRRQFFKKHWSMTATGSFTPQR
jgi:hypothetical protein